MGDCEAFDEGQLEVDDKLDSVSVPRGWNRIIEKGSILYISPNKSRIRCREDLEQYLLLEGSCKCGLECPFCIEDVFNFNPNIPSRLQSNDSTVSPHCSVSKKFSRFFPSGIPSEDDNLITESSSDRKKKRKGQNKAQVFPFVLPESTNGIVSSGVHMPIVPGKRPRKNPCRIPPGLNSANLIRYGRANTRSPISQSIEKVGEGTKLLPDTIRDSERYRSEVVDCKTFDQGIPGPYSSVASTRLSDSYKGSVVQQVSTDMPQTELLFKSMNDQDKTTGNVFQNVASTYYSSLPGLKSIVERACINPELPIGPDEALLLHNGGREKWISDSRQSNKISGSGLANDLATTSSFNARSQEQTTNVVSLGLASCIAMSVSASAEADGDRQPVSDSGLGGITAKTYASKTGNVKGQILSPTAGNLPTPLTIPVNKKVKGKQNRKKAIAQGDSLGRQAQQDKIPAGTSSPQSSKNNEKGPGMLGWNSLPGGTMPSQGNSIIASGSLSSQLSCDPAGKVGHPSSYPSDPGAMNQCNTQIGSRPGSSDIPSLADRTYMQQSTTSVLSEKVTEACWPNSAIRRSAAEQGTVPVSSAMQTSLHGTHINEPVKMPKYMSEGNQSAMADQQTRSPANNIKDKSVVFDSPDVYRTTQKGVSTTPKGAEAPPNVTLSPAQSSNLLPKQNDSRPFLALGNLTMPLGSTQEASAAAAGKSINSTIETRLSSPGTIKNNEKETELRQQAKANVYWCSQNTQLEQSTLSPPQTTVLPSQITLGSKEGDTGATLDQQRPPSSNVWTKNRSVKYQVLTSVASSLPSLTAANRCVVPESTPFTVSSQLTGMQPGRSVAVQPPSTVPPLTLISASGTSVISSSRELLNAPLPVNSQPHVISAQSSTYLLQGQDSTNATTVAQPMVLLRLISQGTSNTKTSSKFTSPSSTSAQAQVLPSSYGIPVTQSLYHSQLGNYAMPGVSGNPGQVFIMGSTHASQALQNLALQSNQGSKESETSGSLVYQTGYSGHTLRSPTASLNYAGIPLQLMTIAGSPVVARSSSQPVTKGDTYAAMLQYYQKQMEFGRIGSNQVQLAPAPGLVRPLQTQVSPTFGNSYIRIAPAFGTMTGKDALVQNKVSSAKGFTDTNHSASMTWPVNEKIKLAVSSSPSLAHEPPSCNTSKEARNTNSPLSPKFEFSRIKYNSYNNTQLTPDKTSMTSAKTTASSTLAQSSLSTDLVDSKHSQANVSPKTVALQLNKNKVSEARTTGSTKTVTAKLADGVNHTGGGPTRKESQQFQQCPGSNNESEVVTDSTAKMSLESSIMSSRYQLQSGRMDSKVSDIHNHAFLQSHLEPPREVQKSTATDRKRDTFSPDRTVSKSFVKERIGEPANYDLRTDEKVPQSLDLTVSPSEGSNFEHVNTITKHYMGTEYPVNDGEKNNVILGSRGLSTSDTSGDLTYATVNKTENQVKTVETASDMPLNKEVVNEQYRGIATGQKYPMLQNVISVQEGTLCSSSCINRQETKRLDADSGSSKSPLLIGENQSTLKCGNDTEEMSLQCLEECSQISGDSSAPSPKCSLKNSPIYFSDAKNKLLQIGDLVWGEFNGSTSWPGKIVNENDVNKEAPDPGKVWVQWFGDHCHEQVNLADLKTLNEGLRHLGGTAKKQNASDSKRIAEHFDQAVCEALREADRTSCSDNHTPETNAKQPRSRGRKRKAK